MKTQELADTDEKNAQADAPLSVKSFASRSARNQAFECILFLASSGAVVKVGPFGQNHPGPVRGPCVSFEILDHCLLFVGKAPF